MLEDTYISNSLIPKRYLKPIQLTPSLQDEGVFNELATIRAQIKEFVDEGNNLLICSHNSGCGKTTWAVKLLLAYIKVIANKSFKNDTPVLFLNVNNFLNEKKLAISDPQLALKVANIEKNILSAKVVVFDDIADKSLSEFDINSLYYWIDSRTSNLKSCIYTSNQLPDQLERTFNGKLYSRVVNYSSIKYITDGDHRQC